MLSKDTPRATVRLLWNILQDTSTVLAHDVLSLTSGNEVQEKWPSGGVQVEKEVIL